MFGFGILEIVLLPFSLFIVGGVFLFFAVRRVQKKLDSANKPTASQFIKELGGYAVLAAILLLYVVVVLLAVIVSAF